MRIQVILDQTNTLDLGVVFGQQILHKFCIIDRRASGSHFSDFPEDLATVVAAWESLPTAVKAGIVAMVNVARRSEQ